MTSGFIAPTNMISVILPVGYRITWSMTTYSAITPRTSEDLTKPDARSHPSSSFANFLAENQNMHVIIFFLRKKFFWEVCIFPWASAHYHNLDEYGKSMILNDICKQLCYGPSAQLRHLRLSILTT